MSADRVPLPLPQARRAGRILCFALASGLAAASAAAPPARETASAPAAAASAPAATVEQPRAGDKAAPAKSPSAAEPSLDVATLKERLRDSRAIGFFTKLELQNQVNDLLQRFRERYSDGKKADVADLRQPFDLLLLKVLALLQDSDPSLAQTIAKSRDAIWNILADPEKFKSAS